MIRNVKITTTANNQNIFSLASVKNSIIERMGWKNLPVATQNANYNALFDNGIKIKFTLLFPADNTVSIMFAEHESGFLAGVATALELQDGELGFIGGLEIPAVQRFNWGFQQGVAYANENLGTKMSIKEENVKYANSFADIPAGKQLAATMYDRGVKAIFCAAGGTGLGAINEAKERVSNGNEVWVVGVDVDQYADGIYDEANNKSVVLTSAMKKIDTATFDVIKAELDGEFPGGEQLTFDAKNDGVGIPAENPNLSKETTDKVAEVFEKVKSGEIVVSGEQGDLIK